SMREYTRAVRGGSMVRGDNAHGISPALRRDSRSARALPLLLDPPVQLSTQRGEEALALEPDEADHGLSASDDQSIPGVQLGAFLPIYREHQLFAGGADLDHDLRGHGHDQWPYRERVRADRRGQDALHGRHHD